MVRLPSWTPGLSFCRDVAFVGNSCIIPRFERYAPGLYTQKVYAVHVPSGRVLGSVVWPFGNPIIAIDWAPRRVVSGLPFSSKSPGSSERAKALFFGFNWNGKATS